MAAHSCRLLACLMLLVVPWMTAAAADEATQEKNTPTSSSQAAKVKMVPLTLAGGEVRFSVPETWKQEKPRSRILEREFSIAPQQDEESPARLTIMPSGGSVKENVERWYTQFTQPNKKATKDVAKVEKKKINGQEAVIVDISGTFKERMGGGPFAPGKTIERENYRMLAGIVQTKTQRKLQYFFKLYGPKPTMDAAEKHFLQMMESVTSSD